MELVIIRPPLVYGPGVKANFLRLLQLGRSGSAPALCERAQPTQLIYVGTRRRDRALRGASRGTRTFLVSDEESVSTPELVSRIAGRSDARQGSFPPRWCFCVSPE